VVVAAAWNVAAVVLRRRDAVARTERMVAEKAPLVRHALQVQWWCARGKKEMASRWWRCGRENDGGGWMRDGTAQVALAVYSRLPWICVCGTLQHFPAKRTAGR